MRPLVEVVVGLGWIELDVGWTEAAVEGEAVSVDSNAAHEATIGASAASAGGRPTRPEAEDAELLVDQACRGSVGVEWGS